MRIVLLAVALAALVPAPAAAQAEPLPGQTWLVPADGFVRSASSWPDARPTEMFSFTVYLDAYAALPDTIAVEVATSPATDPDGTLADASVIDRYEALPLVQYTDVYAGPTRLDARWLGTPGTYYWQASYRDAPDWPPAYEDPA